MVTLTKENAIKAVRKNLDEQGWNPSEMYGVSEDNVELDRIIERTIPEAIDAVHLAAPASALEGAESSFVEEAESDGVLRFRTGKPVLRFVSFRAADSDVAISEAVAENSPNGRMQLNKYVRGTSDNPVLVMQSGTRDCFKYYTVGTRTVNRPRKLADYFYEYNVQSLDYAYAREYFEGLNPDASIGLCSSVRSGNFYGRNYDWYYNANAGVLVRTKAASDRHAVMGVAGGLTGFTKALVDSGVDSELYRILPFYLLDGVNDAGVFCNINVVPNDKGVAETTTPLVSEQDRICSLMLVRYVLDKYSTAQAAVEDLRDHVAIFTPKKLREMGYESHFMIGDATHTYVIEFINDEVVINESEVMTNFYLDGVTLVGGEFVYTNADAAGGNLPSSIGITGHGSGLERYNIAADGLGSANTKAGMRQLMNSLLFTKCYKSDTDPFWYSDYVGVSEDGATDITVDTLPDDDDMIARIEKVKAQYASRSRDNANTWHTEHSSVYDLANGKVYIVAQEDTTVEYELEFNGRVEQTHIAQLSYITNARKADSYQIGTALLTAVIDQLTAMVLAIYGETDKAEYFRSLVNTFINQ